MLPHYYSLNEYLADRFGHKIYKLALNGGMSCPNRDGLIDTRGCIFCSAGGSGDFAADRLTNENHSPACTSISQQLKAAKQLLQNKYKGHSYIAYFQSFTNTYAPVSYLRRIFTEALQDPEVEILSIATRPDCITAEIAALIAELSTIKPVWVELGLQTIHPSTAAYIRRGYSLDIFEQAVALLDCDQIITHMILGLPKETPEDMYATARYIAGNPRLKGIKLQLLHVLRGTDLAADYTNGFFQTLTQKEYFEIISHILPLLPPDMVIHRITGDGPKSLLIAPLWSTDKKNVLNCMTKHLRENNICQGSLFAPSPNHDFVSSDYTETEKS